MDRNILVLNLYRKDTDESDKKAIQDNLLFLVEEGKEAWRDWESFILAELNKLYPDNASDEQKNEIRDQYEIQFRHHFEDEVDFTDFKFPINVSFCNCIFDKYADFKTVHFSGSSTFENVWFKACASFIGTEFGGIACFSSVCFSNNVQFNNSKFCKDVSFFHIDFCTSTEFMSINFGSGVTFQTTSSKEKIIFSHCTFDTFEKDDSVSFVGFNCLKMSVFIDLNFKNKSSLIPCDFRQTYFNTPPSVDDFLSDLTKFKWGNKTENRDKNFYSECEAKFRELKRLAEANNNHQKAMEFYGCELYCHRKASDKWFSPKNCISYIYELISGYGMSLLRPLVLWFAVMVVGLGAQTLLDKQCSILFTFNERMVFYASPSLPPFIQDTIYQKEVRARLYPNDKNDKPRNKKENLEKGQLPMYNRLVRIAQTLFSFIALFLLCLALRNRFKIK